MARKSLKNRIAGTVLALGMLTGIGVVSAPAASAYTDLNPYWQYNCPWPTRYLMAWRDYNWWEETFQWKRDGMVIVRVESIRCYTY